MTRWLTTTVILWVAAMAQSNPDFLVTYKGVPFYDSRYNRGAQKTPGKVMCAYYDLGGEGVADHDNDAKNDGSGGLNPANGSYLNEFRMHEGAGHLLYKIRA
jgi:hypothetical protein